MTHTTALLRKIDRPHIAEMADAVHQDAAAMAHEWSEGSVLTMQSKDSIAGENTVRILLLAAQAALDDAGDKNMAGLISSYLRGRVAQMTFAHRNDDTYNALETGAACLEGFAEDIAADFRAGIGN